MKYERTARLKLKNKPLFELLEFGEKERRVFPELLKALKTPRRPQELPTNTATLFITSSTRCSKLE